MAGNNDSAQKYIRSLSLRSVIALTAIALLVIAGHICQILLLDANAESNRRLHAVTGMLLASQELTVAVDDLLARADSLNRSPEFEIVQLWVAILTDSTGNALLQKAWSDLRAARGYDASPGEGHFLMLEPFVQAGRRILADSVVSGPQLVSRADTLRKFQRIFARQATAVKEYLEAASRAKSASLNRVETWLLFLVGLTLLLSGLFIIRPTVRHMRRYMESRNLAVEDLKREVQERKSAEAALKRSEQEYRGLIENAHDAIIIFTVADEKVLDVNTRACQLYGYSREEFIGISMETLSKNPRIGKERIAETLSSGASIHFQTVHYRKDGGELTLEVHGTLVNYRGQKAIMSINRDIAENNQAEAALRASEKRYSMLFQYSYDPIFIHDLSGGILDFNQRAIRQFGYDADTLHQMTFHQLYPPDQQNPAIAAMNEMVEKGFSRFEIELARRNGERFMSEISARRFEIDGQLLVQAIVRDISRRKRDERLRGALYRIAERASYIEDMDAFYAAMHDIVAELMYAENFYIALYDHERDVMQFPYFVDEFDERPRPRKKARGLTEFVIRSERPLLVSRQEVLSMIDKGEIELIGEAPVDWLGIPLKSGDSTFGALVVQSYRDEVRFAERDKEMLIFVAQTVANALERKQSLEHLFTERKWLTVTMRSIADGVITTNTSGRILLINKIAEKLTGRSQLDAAGVPIERVIQIVDCNDPTNRFDPVQKALSGEQIVEIGAAFIVPTRPDLPKRIISASAAPIHDENQQIIGAVLAFRDITDQEKLARELQKAQKLESIGILAGGIAHDFNNILTAIIGNISLVRAGVDREDSRYRRLQEAEKACNRARDLTQQLLTFSKGGAPIKVAASVGELVRDAAGFASLGSKVRCDFDIPADLWPIEADRGQISQVINNIVLNGLQAMPKGGKIYIECRNVVVDSESFLNKLPLNPGKYVCIAIRDEGVGIPDDIIQQIFDPYFSTKQMGSGLGLATSYSIIARHGGYITATSNPDVGCTFLVYLPSSPGLKFVRRQDQESGFQGDGRVLFMDDQPAILEVTGIMLKRLGFEVTQVRDGKAAIEAYRDGMENERPFDLVILDLTIPGGMGGKETLEQLRSIDSGVRAIVASGYSNDPIMSDYRKYGFIACILKPFNLREINRIMRQVQPAQIQQPKRIPGNNF